MPAIAHLYSAGTQREFGFHLAAENCAKAGGVFGVCVCVLALYLSFSH